LMLKNVEIPSTVVDWPHEDMETEIQIPYHLSFTLSPASKNESAVSQLADKPVIPPGRITVSNQQPCP
jgi:hypothetical protein